MTSTDRAAGSQVWTEDAARSWVDNALRLPDVDFPWRMAAELIKHDRPQTRVVLDAASGPGGFLASALDVLPDARGIWFDMSSTMLAEAKRALARFGSRVDYQIGTFADISSVVATGGVDLVITSRATHHLALPELTRFYQDVAGLLVTDGWVANLDSMSDSPQWRARLRAVRAQYRAAAGVPDVPTHEQLNVSPTLSEHLAALKASGFADIELVWRVFVTGLLMARKVDPATFLK
jgi:trans-aconitate methyltransferase